MKPSATVRGRIARATAGAEAIEIKATVPDRQIRMALKRFGLDRSNDEQRYIYFFDTPGLDLLRAGIITRARRIVGDTHDCTVKLRPVEPADVASKWRKYRDFKNEADASEEGLVKSASFSMPAEKRWTAPKSRNRSQTRSAVASTRSLTLTLTMLVSFAPDHYGRRAR